MDDDNLEEQKKKEQDEAGQKTAHVAGKAAATYFGGGAGGKIYDAASNTAIGKQIEEKAGKTLQHVPGMNKAMEGLNKNGALDMADKGLNLAGGGNSGLPGHENKGLSNLSDIPITKSNNENTSQNEESDNSNSLSGTQNDDSEDEKDNFNSLDNLVGTKTRKKIIFSFIIGFIAIIFMFFILVMTKLYPLKAASDFVEGIWDGISSLFTKDQQTLENEFYQELKNVQQDYHSQYGVCIDVNLITASLMAIQNFDDMLENGDYVDENGETFLNPDGNSQTLPYKRMKKQIRLLARMQMMTKRYELVLENESYCSMNSGEFLITEGNKDSSTYKLIASHDMNGFQAFFTSKVNEEQNNAYYIYRPPFNENGTCSLLYANNMLPEDKVELSIESNKGITETVFYWNLVNSFIPSYYEEYISKTEPQRTEDIKRIVDEIYMLYEQIGPSKNCSISYAGPSSLCPNGITIENEGTFEFEEYIAGVVSNEAYSSEGIEALKAQAVAARTYALNMTNYCQKSIPNSTNAQTFTRNINDKAKEAVNATRGEILVDKEGKVFSAMYDSFCYDDKDCPDATRNSDGTYSVTYTRMPDGEKHKITLSDSKQYGRILPGQGHAHGMSQLLSYQFAKEGKDYKEILSYFYSSSVQISLVLSPTTTDGSKIIQGPVNNYLANANTSVAAFNQNIYSQVIKSGLSTREGVVAAATTLVSEFYNQTGYKLPYELLPSGKYSGYGMDPNWGTSTGNTTYPLNGLDCSGFISWSIHNGGFAYEVKSASDWGKTGIKRSWSKGITDSGAKPGDLIFNAPSSSNGTTGHIRMIIAVNSDGYIVAEASSRKNGIRINNISFTSTGPYYLVDMSNYYETATKVTDYPM